jgi:hypothetical protein
MQRKSQKHLKWKLQPLERVDLGWLGFEGVWRKSISKHPLLPIGIGLLVAYASGVKYMFPMNIAIVVLAMWLYIDLLPLAHWLSVRKVTMDTRFSRERISESADCAASESEQLEVLRANVLTRIRWTYRTILFLLVAISCVLSIAYVLDKGYQELRNDVRDHLEATAAVPTENSVSTAEITIRNQSSSDVLLEHFFCRARKLVLEDGSIPGTSFSDYTFGQNFNGIRITRGGDGQTLSCTPEQLIHNEGAEWPTRCADLQWEIYYKIPSHLQTTEMKSYRYILQKGHKTWEQVAIDAPISVCQE